MKNMTIWKRRSITPMSTSVHASVASNSHHTRRSWRKHLGFMASVTLLRNSSAITLLWKYMARILRGMGLKGTRTAYTGIRFFSLPSTPLLGHQLTDNRFSLIVHVRCRSIVKKRPFRRQRFSMCHRRGAVQARGTIQLSFKDQRCPVSYLFKSAGCSVSAWRNRCFR